MLLSSPPPSISFSLSDMRFCDSCCSCWPPCQHATRCVPIIGLELWRSWLTKRSLCVVHDMQQVSALCCSLHCMPNNDVRVLLSSSSSSSSSSNDYMQQHAPTAAWQFCPNFPCNVWQHNQVAGQRLPDQRCCLVLAVGLSAPDWRRESSEQRPGLLPSAGTASAPWCSRARLHIPAAPSSMPSAGLTRVQLVIVGVFP